MTRANSVRRVAVAVSGCALLGAGAAGLPLWAAGLSWLVGGPPLVCTVARGKGAGPVAAVGVLALAACALVPGSRLGAPQTVAVAVTLTAYLAAVEVREAPGRLAAVRTETAGALAAVAVLTVVLLLSPVAAVWLVPVGLAALVGALAVAVSGVRGRR